MKEIKKIINALKKYDNFLITSHINPEGDSIGSQLAMAVFLKKLGKNYIIFNHDSIPREFEFMLSGEKIKTDLAKTDKFETAIVIDCPVVERTGKVSAYLKKAKLVLNIDHHVSNTNFGDITWIEPDMSSCGEMLYYLYKNTGVGISRAEALSMYIAILTDTGSFSYENTTYETHQIVSELLKTGIKPLWVGRRLNEIKSLNDLKLLEETLKTLKLYCNGQIVTLYTSRAMLERLHLGHKSTESFVNYGRSIKSVKIAVFFLERPHMPGAVHVSFRSKGDIDVDKIAELFKGGGHRNASGCLIKGSISHVKKIVLEKVKRYLRDSRG